MKLAKRLASVCCRCWNKIPKNQTWFQESGAKCVDLCLLVYVQFDISSQGYIDLGVFCQLVCVVGQEVELFSLYNL